MADDLILEVVNVAVAAQGQVSAVALGIAAVKLHAVDGTNVVDVDSVSVSSGAVSDFLVGGVVGQDVLVDVVADVLVGDLAQVGVDGDVSVVIGQGDVIQSGDILQVAVVVVSLGEAEISQVVVSGLVRLCGLLGGGGLSGFLGSSGFGSSLAGSSASAACQGSGHAQGQHSGQDTVHGRKFHGILLFLKIAYLFIIHAFWQKYSINDEKGVKYGQDPAKFSPKAPPAAGPAPVNGPGKRCKRTTCKNRDAAPPAGRYTDTG